LINKKYKRNINDMNEYHSCLLILTKYAWWTNSNINKNVVLLTNDIIVSHIKFLIDRIYLGSDKYYYNQNKGIPITRLCSTAS
jgi:hypothetical protein